jgi:steroid 5-alpha reductase family enzyme
MKKISKGLSLTVVFIVYLATFFAGLLIYQLLDVVPVWGFLFADAAATVVVWAFGLLFKNASMYDPYWSVAPLVLFVFFVLEAQSFDMADVLYLLVFAFWGVRLTVNWIIGWTGMHHQDWRYTMLHDQNPSIWPLTNFFGINMMPTLIVYINMLPAYYSAQAVGSLSIVTVSGAAVCILAAALQIVSDGQMRRFRLNPENRGRNMETGLWKYSRHPNYLGEVSFWWGVYIMMLGQLPGMWWAIFAPILMTLLFVFVSVPMMEKRLIASKPGYAVYKKTTSMLLILPQRAIQKDEDAIDEAL